MGLQKKHQRASRMGLASLAVLAFFPCVLAGASPRAATQDANQELLAIKARAALAARYPGADVQLSSGLSYATGPLPERVQAVSVLNENERGDAQLQIDGTNSDGSSASAQGWIHFTAMIPAWVAKRRVTPGERLDPSSFVIQKIDLAQGMAHEYRGLILPTDSDLAALQARQTVLQGQFVLSNAVQRVPDVNRGDSVRIQLDAGAVTLTTHGTAQEPGYVNDQLRVMTAKTKKVLVGKLAKDGVVEVKL